MQIQIKKLKNNAIIPTCGSKYSAGYDLYAALDTDSVVIPAHATVKIGTGLSLALPEGYFGAIFARSGLATKQGLRPANCVGVADCDYRGEYLVALHNDTDQPKAIANGDRIAQLVVLPCMTLDFEEVEELSDTERGAGGFGSTGKGED